MARAHVEVIHEVRSGVPNEWNLCFQWVRYHYTDGFDSQMGYRFIWRRPNNHLQPAMGQARIPSAASMFHLIKLAMDEGWFVVAEKSRDDDAFCDDQPKKENIDLGGFSKNDCENVLQLLIPKSSNPKCIEKTFKEFLKRLKIHGDLIIIDPYFFAPKNDASYLNLVVDILSETLECIDDITFVTAQKNDHEKLKLELKNCLLKKKPKLNFLCEKRDDFHDRFWLSKTVGKGLFVGTSLNGVGKRYSLIDVLDKEDVKDILLALAR